MVLKLTVGNARELIVDNGIERTENRDVNIKENGVEKIIRNALKM